MQPNITWVFTRLHVLREQFFFDLAYNKRRFRYYIYIAKEILIIITAVSGCYTSTDTKFY